MGWLWYVLAALWLLDAVHIRGRLAALHGLESSSNAPSPEYRFVATPGVKIPEETRRAASAYAAETGVEMIDLLPADMPALLGIYLLQLIDTKTYRANRVGPGVAAGFALLYSRELGRRAGVATEPVLHPIEMARIAKRLKRFAPGRADLVIARGLQATSDHLTGNWPVYEETIGLWSRPLFLVRACILALLLAGLAVDPWAGAVALGAFHLQVLLVFARQPLQPRDLVSAILFRTPMEIARWLQTLRSRVRYRGHGADRISARRAYYAAALADGTGQFFEPRRDDCPFCGSRELTLRLRANDLVQRKPGVFVLEQCRHCGHIFQNPRLSAKGLEFYYQDCYDGLGAENACHLFGTRPDVYVKRSNVVKGMAEPRRWLDVGACQGHFCCVAKSVWPNTRFEGLDLAEGVEEGASAGWMDAAYRGSLPDLAPKLAGRYDVVSLFHCLEHTPDPAAELDAAHTVLAPGGLLLLEMPNPECFFGRYFGQFWWPWFQPQHLHMFSARNLQSLLRRHCLEPVWSQPTEARANFDIANSLILFCAWLAPNPDVPWRTAPGWVARVRQGLVWCLAFPVLLVAGALDLALAPWLRRLQISNAYRIVARRCEGQAEPPVTSAADVRQAAPQYSVPHGHALDVINDLHRHR